MPSLQKTPEDALITSYYLWLPYLLSLLFALAKLPHSMWKRFFENNLINSIIGGNLRVRVVKLYLLWIPGGVGGEEKDDRLEDSASKSSIRRFVITEKAPTRAFSWLKAATTAFTFIDT